MRIWIFWGYLVFLFIVTCTENVSLFLLEQHLTFDFKADPPVLDFFKNDFSLQDPTYVNQKLGHILSFFFLGAIIYSIWRSAFIILLISMAVALSTEVAQLFFSRSGRLLDVGYDMVGALLFVILVVGYRCLEFIIRKKQLVPVNRR